MNQTRKPLVGPHISTDLTISRVMLDVVLALVPVLAAATILFGLPALVITALACVSACLTEWLIVSRRATPAALWGDGSAAVTGILLGLTLSPLAPWWVPVIGGALAIGIGKQLFGGLGHNIFNPALVARAILLLAWPAHSVRFATPFEGTTGATPLLTGAAGLWDLAVGIVPGAIGETSVLAILVGGVYLLIRKHIDWRIPSGVIAGALAAGWILGRDPVYGVLAGGLMLAAVFMATDMVTSPVTRAGRIVFGLLVGGLTVAIRHYSVFPEGVTFAILLSNALVPVLDRCTIGLRFGEAAGARWKSLTARPAGLESFGLRTREPAAGGPAGAVLPLLVAVIVTGTAVLGVAAAARDLGATRAAAAAAATLGDVLPAADSFEETEIAGRTIFIGTAGGRDVGAAFYWSERGFNGPVTLLVGVDTEGALTGAKVSDHAEDPGLGSRVAGKDFLAQFDGKTYDDDIALGRDIEAISGATISSRAVTAGVRNALSFFATALLGVDPGDDVDLADVPDGLYTGTAGGFMGPITVEVEMAGGRIVSVTVVSHTDTPSIAGPALETVAGRMVSAQALDVDAVTGATVSSEALMEAVKNALLGIEPGQPPPSVDLSSLPDGIYAGTGGGFLGDIRVSVTVRGGRLEDVRVTRHEDTPDIAGPALRRLTERMLEGQTVDVDAVSGATVSSRGLVEAVVDALSRDPVEALEPLDITAVPDGEYEGSADGFMGAIRVVVVVRGGRIESVQVTRHEDTPDIANPAFGQVIDRIVEGQRVTVDAVSGATISSRGLMRAVENALREAGGSQ